MTQGNEHWLAAAVTLGVCLYAFVLQFLAGVELWIVVGLTAVGVYWVLIRWVRRHSVLLAQEVETQVINDLIQQLPASFVIGAKTPQAVLRRAIQLWDDSATMEIVLDRILEGIILVSPEGTVLMHNQRAEDLLGEPTSHLLKEWAQHKEPKKALKRALKGLIYETSWFVGEKPQRQYLEVIGLPLESGALLVIRDITKIRQLERMRRDFVANISHELRTPITTILMNMEVLMAEYSKNPFVEAIDRNTNRLSRLVNGLLDLSRIEAGQMELSIQAYLMHPIVTRVGATLQTRAGQKKQRIVIDVPIDLSVHVDAQAIEQVLTNLVSNACKYSMEGANIIIRGYLQSRDVFIEVEDNGLGVPEKHQQRLFERFYRIDKGRARDEGGTGLGLAIVRHLVEAMNGEVGVRNAEPKGAIFWVRLPLMDED